MKEDVFGIGLIVFEEFTPWIGCARNFARLRYRLGYTLTYHINCVSLASIGWSYISIKFTRMESLNHIALIISNVVYELCEADKLNLCRIYRSKQDITTMTLLFISIFIKVQVGLRSAVSAAFEAVD